MGILGSVVQISTLPVYTMGEHSLFGGAIAAEFVGYDDPRFAVRAAKQFTKEALGRNPVVFRLNHDVDYGLF
jgi:hydroxymethylpyrimidine/phosphomethylpyrimidine kinase